MVVLFTGKKTEVKSQTEVFPELEIEKLLTID